MQGYILPKPKTEEQQNEVVLVGCKRCNTSWREVKLMTLNGPRINGPMNIYDYCDACISLKEQYRVKYNLFNFTALKTAAEKEPIFFLKLIQAGDINEATKSLMIESMGHTGNRYYLDYIINTLNNETIVIVREACLIALELFLCKKIEKEKVYDTLKVYVDSNTYLNSVVKEILEEQVYYE